MPYTLSKSCFFFFLFLTFCPKFSIEEKEIQFRHWKIHNQLNRMTWKKTIFKRFTWKTVSFEFIHIHTHMGTYKRWARNALHLKRILGDCTRKLVLNETAKEKTTNLFPIILSWVLRTSNNMHLLERTSNNISFHEIKKCTGNAL